MALQTTVSVASASVKFAVQKASYSATTAFAVAATLPQSEWPVRVALRASYSAITVFAVAAILPQSEWLVPVAQRGLYSATTPAAGEAVMASGASVPTRTRMSIQAFVVAAAAAMMASCSASAARVVLIPMDRAAGIASATPM